MNILITLMFVALQPTDSAAKSVALNPDQRQAEYSRALALISAGDTVVFPDGSFRVGGRIGDGSTTAVYELTDEPGAVLRIPLSAFRFYMQETIEGHATLHSAGIPLLQLLRWSPKFNWAVVERLPRDHVLLSDFLNRREEERLSEEMLQALLQFTRRTAHAEWIGDAKATNIAFLPARGEWVLFDWLNVLRPFDKLADFSVSKLPFLVYSDLTDTAEPVIALLQREVEAARTGLTVPPPSCTEDLRAVAAK